jgi:hypothetical protein
MYADLLRGQGVPVVLRPGGAGRGALGGAAVEVEVIVSEAQWARARDLLNTEDAAASDVDERKDGSSR